MATTASGWIEGSGVYPLIAAVAPGPRPLSLRIVWAEGRGTDVVDLAPLLARHAVFAPLADPDALARVEIGEFATDLVWPGGIDVAATTLWRLARDQAAAAA